MRPPEGIRSGLGYDEMGNAAHLLTEVDRYALEKGDFIRADGNARCCVCDYPLNQHPPVQGALWLTRSCWGLVKL
jgi:hypothetical protein